jgi:hypothetical protein
VLDDFRTSNELALAGDEQDKQLNRLALHAEGAAFAEQFEAAAVEPKVAELIDGTCHGYPCPLAFDATGLPA